MELFIFGWSLGLAAALVNHQVFVRPRIKSAVSELRSIRSAIEPVPTSERPWERDGWCDAEGRCYGWDGDYWWMVGNPGWANVTITHWLPYWVLPVPALANTINQED